MWGLMFAADGGGSHGRDALERRLRAEAQAEPGHDVTPDPLVERIQRAVRESACEPAAGGGRWMTAAGGLALAASLLLLLGVLIYWSWPRHETPVAGPGPESPQVPSIPLVSIKPDRRLERVVSAGEGVGSAGMQAELRGLMTEAREAGRSLLAMLPTRFGKAPAAAPSTAPGDG